MDERIEYEIEEMSPSQLESRWKVEAVGNGLVNQRREHIAKYRFKKRDG